MPEVWQFIAGLGMFLLGMMHLENAMAGLTGASFKRFIRQHTQHPAQAIVVGICVTAVLQSSSLVSLMLLALTGAGIMTLRNALGVIIGANLGTTFTGWVVTTLGFKMNLDQFALPLLGIGCIGYVFLQPGRTLHSWFTFLAGFGFLLFGLGFMKTSAAGLANVVDVSLLADHGLFVFLVFGFVLTAIIQSSSACMMIVLSAVNAGIIELPMAAAVVVGADLGTTMTTVLGALKGSAIKRQVALAHVLFNLVTDVIAFLMIVPLLGVITGTLGITDPLYGTVAFHSVFNIIGILIFYPTLGRFAQFLERRFVHREAHAAKYLHEVPRQEPDLHLIALRKDLRTLLEKVIHFNRQVLGISDTTTRDWPAHEKDYNHMKDLEGEILAACIALQDQPLNSTQSNQLNRIILATRAAAHSAKSIKDVYVNLREFYGSEQPAVLQFMQVIRNDLSAFYAIASDCLADTNPAARLENIRHMQKCPEMTYDHLWRQLGILLRKHQTGDIENATLSGMNRELHSSGKSLAESLDALFQSSATDANL